MQHNDAVRLLRSCPCPCHSHNPGCWCNTAERDPLEISHNDRIRLFGHCDCRVAPCTHQSRTAPQYAHAIEDLERTERDRRIATGRVRSSDIAHIVRHPGKYPHYFR